MSSCANSNADIEFDDVNCSIEDYSEMTSSREVSQNTIGHSPILENRDRPPKRNRLTDNNELWTTVTRKGKRLARIHDLNDMERIPEDLIEVCVSSTEKLPRQFRLAKMLKSEKIQNVAKIEYINAFKVLIQFSDENSCDTFINCQLFKDQGYKCQKKNLRN